MKLNPPVIIRKHNSFETVSSSLIPYFFKMVQGGKDIYGFVRTTKENIKTQMFSLIVGEKQFNINSVNPVAYYNQHPENNGFGDVGMINRFERGAYEELKRDVLETNWIEKISLYGKEYDVYQIINKD